MAQFSNLDHAFEGMSVQKALITPTLEMVSTDHIAGRESFVNILIPPLHLLLRNSLLELMRIVLQITTGINMLIPILLLIGRVEEKEASGFASYRDLRAKAKTQYCHWMDEVRRPRFPEGFDKDPYALQPLPKEPDWFEELANLRFDPSPYFRAGHLVNPDGDSQQAKELLAAFAFLDINIL
ncbi:hypothetical protein RHMOL_Rhmol10G0118700 [Rhododendron molle]|uniref:Uncharacterized protein n=1 Tax=Rhododendron molle TaxID=49168 RepID=A0ACC0M1T7_RHOML|nr:hypothetical protein RHMOL_Rhmol10G0118700 [Rhododendron molle]